jgi:hypothetical protein
MMIACCIPMIVIAIVLVLTGIAGPQFRVRGDRVHGDDGPNDVGHGPRQRRGQRRH